MVTIKKINYFENVENQHELAKQKIKNIEEKYESEKLNSEKYQS